MNSSNHEVNTCRDIVPYVPQIPIISNAQIENDVRNIIVPQELAGRKRRLVTTKIIIKDHVDFVIVPSEGEANVYTIKLSKNEQEPSHPHGLNLKYHDMLLGWTTESERRQRQNGKYDTFYLHERTRKTCRSVEDVRRHIFQGSDKLKIEVDQETNTVIELTVGVVEKFSEKIKGESSISGRESSTKKLKSNEHHNYENSEVVKFFADAWNVVNMDG